MLANEQDNIIHPPLISNVSLFISYPVAVHITNNTFVRNREDGDSGKEDSVGMVVNINAAEDQVTIRYFFSWLQLVQQIEPLRYDNVSFWKQRNSTHPPFYL